MKKLSFKRAKELSILKWKWIISNPGELYSRIQMIIEIPGLEDLRANCGFCARYIVENNAGNAILAERCLGCPLMLEGISCFDPTHIFQQWGATGDIKYAREILSIIEESKEKRCKR